MPVHLVFCSCPDPAHHLATTLVEQQLAACVSQLPPMHSLYRRQGTVEQADEVLLAKTPAGCLRALPPHELPEIVAVEAGACLDWVAVATRD